MRVLVTGTAGFIGNRLAHDLLSEGLDVAGVDAITPYYNLQLKHDRLATLAQFDGFKNHVVMLEDFDALTAVFDQFKPDVVVHLAAQAGVRYSLEHPRAYVDSNVVGSFNVIELAKQHCVKHLVIASTSSAYGANPKTPFEENDVTRHPLTIYAAIYSLSMTIDK